MSVFGGWWMNEWSNNRRMFWFSCIVVGAWAMKRNLFFDFFLFAWECYEFYQNWIAKTGQDESNGKIAGKNHLSIWPWYCTLHVHGGHAQAHLRPIHSSWMKVANKNNEKCVFSSLKAPNEQMRRDLRSCEWISLSSSFSRENIVIGFRVSGNRWTCWNVQIKKSSVRRSWNNNSIWLRNKYYEWWWTESWELRPFN